MNAYDRPSPPPHPAPLPLGARIVRFLAWTAAVLWSLVAIGVLGVFGMESEAAGGWDWGLTPGEYLSFLLSIPAALAGAWLTSRWIRERATRLVGKQVWLVPLVVAFVAVNVVYTLATVVGNGI